jgi:hypothetical protein
MTCKLWHIYSVSGIQRYETFFFKIRVKTDLYIHVADIYIYTHTPPMGAHMWERDSSNKRSCIIHPSWTFFIKRQLFHLPELPKSSRRCPYIIHLWCDGSPDHAVVLICMHQFFPWCLLVLLSHMVCDMCVLVPSSPTVGSTAITHARAPSPWPWAPPRPCWARSQPRKRWMKSKVRRRDWWVGSTQREGGENWVKKVIAVSPNYFRFSHSSQFRDAFSQP